MKRFIQGESRIQSTLLPAVLDDYIADTNPVRVVDVFVDEDVMFIGIANEDEHTIRSISRDEAVKLIGLLQEGLTKANEWDRYKKFRKVSEAEDSSKAEDTEQDPNIY